MKSDQFYKKCISEILGVGEKDVRFDSPPSYIEVGTKSIIRDVLCKGKSYIFKKYNEEAIDLGERENPQKELYKEFLRDIVALHFLGGTGSEVFPKILSYNYVPFREDMALLMQTVHAKTLKEAMEMAHPEEQWANLTRAFSTFRHALAIMQESGGMIEQELQTASGYTVGLKEKSVRDYIENYKIYSQILNGQNLDLKALSKYSSQFPQLAERYFNDLRLRRIGQSDLYPHNITLESMLDFGTIGHVSIPLLMGCLLGHPSVFNYLGKREDRIQRIGHFVEDLSYSGMLDFSLKKKTIEGTLFGAVFGNMRIAAGLVKRNLEDRNAVNKFLSTSKKQANDLKALGVIQNADSI